MENSQSILQILENHPSIIMWSTGNEVEERDGSADGYAWSRRLADKVRSLDSTRPVSGDFVWTAWDYIGEVGVGRWEISDESRPGPAAYPWLLANCSDIDLLGRKRPQSYYRDVVWKSTYMRMPRK